VVLLFYFVFGFETKQSKENKGLILVPWSMHWMSKQKQSGLAADSSSFSAAWPRKS